MLIALQKLVPKENLGGNQNIIVDSSLIQINGKDRLEKERVYYSQIQRYQRHSSAGLRNTRIGVGSIYYLTCYNKMVSLC